MCTLIFPIPIYTFFSLSAPFLYLLFSSPSYHFHFYLQLFPYSFSEYLSFALSLSPSLWLKLPVPDWKVSTLPKTEKRLEASSPFVACHHLPNGWRRLNPYVLACSRYPHPAQCSLLSSQLGKTYLKCSASPVLYWGGEGARQASQKTL